MFKSHDMFQLIIILKYSERAYSNNDFFHPTKTATYKVLFLECLFLYDTLVKNLFPAQ